MTRSELELNTAVTLTGLGLLLGAAVAAGSDPDYQRRRAAEAARLEQERRRREAEMRVEARRAELQRLNDDERVLRDQLAAVQRRRNGLR